jgi:hypothetical protein
MGGGGGGSGRFSGAVSSPVLTQANYWNVANPTNAFYSNSVGQGATNARAQDAYGGGKVVIRYLI